MKRYGIIGLGLFCCLASIPPLLRVIQAQHIDVFKLGPGGSGEPPKRPEAPETHVVKVEDFYSYEVPIEKDKIDKDNILRTDVELVELLGDKDKATYQWHQVEILEDKDVTQLHTRTVGKLKCTRKRTGTIYWVPDGTKYVDWGTWSMWDCAKGE